MWPLERHFCLGTAHEHALWQDLVTRRRDEPVDGGHVTRAWRSCQLDLHGLQLAVDHQQQINFKAVMRAPDIQVWLSILPCTEHFRIMAYAQLTWRESLRDIEVTLGANASKLYGMGRRQAVRRSTLADANERRDWRIWADFAAVLIRRANKLYCVFQRSWTLVSA